MLNTFAFKKWLPTESWRKSGVLPEFVLAKLLVASVPAIIIRAKKKGCCPPQRLFLSHSAGNSTQHVLTESRPLSFSPLRCVTKKNSGEIKRTEIALNNLVLLAQTAICADRSIWNETFNAISSSPFSAAEQRLVCVQRMQEAEATGSKLVCQGVRSVEYVDLWVIVHLYVHLFMHPVQKVNKLSSIYLLMNLTIYSLS